MAVGGGGGERGWGHAQVLNKNVFLTKPKVVSHITSDITSSTPSQVSVVVTNIYIYN